MPLPGLLTPLLLLLRYPLPAHRGATAAGVGHLPRVVEVVQEGEGSRPQRGEEAGQGVEEGAVVAAGEPPRP